MLEIVEEQLLKRRRDHGAMPSVREIARDLGASPQTVHKALRHLAERGVVHALERKGFFWGPDPSADRAHEESAEDRIRAGILSDLRKGAFHPWKELPSRSALSQMYGCGTRRVGRILQDFAERGILQRRGRAFFPMAQWVPRSPSTFVLLVVRCGGNGELLSDTEREIDFLKSVRRELAEQGLGLLRLGYHEEGGGRFLDRRGMEIRLQDIREPLLGAIASTWLLEDPIRLLDLLSATKRPISAWWEHPEQDFPLGRFPAGLAGFDISFGESPGESVGRHLAAEGRLDVAFLSPYHGNDWSRARLRGLSRHIQACGGSVREFVDDDVRHPWELQLRGRGTAGMVRLVERILLRFLDDPQLLRTPTWVFSNDLAACAMHRILLRRGEAPPYMVGFDNTSESEKIGFDSFEFHTDGMVRQMLMHLANPKAEIFSSPPIREMVGRLVVRSRG